MATKKKEPENEQVEPKVEETSKKEAPKKSGTVAL